LMLVCTNLLIPVRLSPEMGWEMFWPSSIRDVDGFARETPEQRFVDVRPRKRIGPLNFYPN
jgi:hypothetical protein